MKILLTAVGKRIQLIKKLKIASSVIGTDAGDLVAASYFVDKFYKVKKYYEDGYVEQLLDICHNEKIDYLIPLYEKEFELLCNCRELFQRKGTKLLLSSKKIIEICNDKSKTYEFFKANNICCPKTYFKEGVPDNVKFPLIIKPFDGMGSSNVFKIKNKKELQFFIQYVENPIVQEFIEGTEFTIDVLCDLKGNVIFSIPRERIEVRAGEVSKSRTVKNEKIIRKVKELCNKLNNIEENEFLIGPLTIQCILNKNNEVYFIEINPRFGGGVPLSFQAGGNYALYLNKMRNGEDIEPLEDFKEITMLRYDEAIFI